MKFHRNIACAVFLFVFPAILNGGIVPSGIGNPTGDLYTFEFGLRNTAGLNAPLVVNNDVTFRFGAPNPEVSAPYINLGAGGLLGQQYEVEESIIAPTPMTRQLRFVASVVSEQRTLFPSEGLILDNLPIDAAVIFIGTDDPLDFGGEVLVTSAIAEFRSGDDFTASLLFNLTNQLAGLWDGSAVVEQPNADGLGTREVELVIDILIPEPSTVVLLIAALGIANGRQRSR